jgi:hypothetical protein
MQTLRPFSWCIHDLLYLALLTMDTYSHLLEDIGGYAIDGLDEAFC